MKNLVSTKITRNPMIGVSFVKCSLPLKATRLPRVESTKSTAFSIIGNIKTKIKAKMIIINFLSEALVLDAISNTAMYSINATSTVAKINHRTNIKVEFS